MSESEGPWVRYAALNAQQQSAPIGQEDGPWLRYQRQGTAPVVPSGTASASAPGAAAHPQTPMTAADVLSGAVQNFLPSAGQFAQDIAQPILHPIQTAQNLGDIAGGVAAKAGIGDHDQHSADAVGQFFAGRYGGFENVKKTMATDPVGFLSDVATLLSGGSLAAAKAPGVLGTVARAAGTAGEILDPVQAAGKVVTGTGRAVGTGVSAGLGLTTGVGGDAIRSMQRAGFEGNTAALEQMRGAAPSTEILDRAKSALGQLDRDRATKYNADMAPARADQSVLNFSGIDNAIRDANDMVRFKGVVKNREGADIVNQMKSVVDDWKQLTPADYHTPAGFDALKQTLGGIRESTEAGTPARKVADTIYRRVRDDVEAQVPSYAAAMRGYENATNNSNQIRKTLSLGENATDDTGLRKLLSSTRSNVSANFGTRAALVDQLAQKEPALPGMLAGRAMSGLEPQGLARVLHSGAAYAVPGAALLSNPPALLAALSTLAVSSPRVIGEAAYGVGGARRAFNPAFLSPAQRLLLRQSAFQAGRAARVSGQ
ncbi:hypothetical protein [Mesorhizobium argentiipisi]|uniref:Uncharacterized protein n=1 Tax=Mesorhizobium argentiipisi TaxID=3015175 RepID=A0ABU8KJM9_9HYPH